MSLPSARTFLATALAVALAGTSLSAWSRPGVNLKKYKLELKGTYALPTSVFGTVTVDDPVPLLPMRIQVSFSDLPGKTTGAQIHCCTSAPGDSGVAIEVSGFPLGVTDGHMDQTFNLALAPTYSSLFISNNGGTAQGAFAALAAAMDAGQSYFSIRTEAFPNGEVRALMVPVPEPSSWALLAAGLAGVGLTVRRRRSA